MSKTITFTDEELNILRSVNFNECLAADCYLANSKHDCFDMNKKGEYFCKYIKIVRSIEKKLEEDEEWMNT